MRRWIEKMKSRIPNPNPNPNWRWIEKMKSRIPNPNPNPTVRRWIEKMKSRILRKRGAVLLTFTHENKGAFNGRILAWRIRSLR